jgi:hypothetical protein
MKIADSVRLSLYMRDNENEIFPTPSSTDLSGTQFLTLKTLLSFPLMNTVHRMIYTQIKIEHL